MKLNDLGEFGLINRIAPQFQNNLEMHNLIGIGDDCAVMPFNEEESLIITTDLLIENIHFLKSKIPSEDLGHKSLGVNLSDIAAMGGEPISAYLSIGIPKETEIEWLDSFFEGVKKLADETNTKLLGGDTTKSKEGIIINFTIIGKQKTDRIKYRKNAKVGDYLCLTGKIGDSGGGLNMILDDLEATGETESYLIKAHHRPHPHLEYGKWLSKHTGVHAMIDVSDGIDSDITRIMEQAEVGAEVNLENLPISNELKNASNRYGWDYYQLAVAGGEDYCLLLTVDPKDFEKISNDYTKEFNSELYKIGEVTESRGRIEYLKNGEKYTFGKQGFDHFQS
jgi:thiamine-monophosphate kinase